MKNILAFKLPWVFAFTVMFMGSCSKDEMKKIEPTTPPVVFTLKPARVKVGDTITLSGKLAYENAPTEPGSSFKNIEVIGIEAGLIESAYNISDKNLPIEEIKKSYMRPNGESGDKLNVVYDSKHNEFNISMRLIPVKPGKYTLVTFGGRETNFPILLQLKKAWKQGGYPNTVVMVNGAKQQLNQIQVDAK